MLAHKATHEDMSRRGRSGHKASFDARQIPSVAYTDPEIAWRARRGRAQARREAYGKSVFPWSASGRRSPRREDGFVKLLSTRRPGGPSAEASSD